MKKKKTWTLTNNLDFLDVAVARGGRFLEQAPTRVRGIGRRLWKREVLDRQQECLYCSIGPVRLSILLDGAATCDIPNGSVY